MRLPLPTDLNTRDGTLTKDAKLMNAFVDGENVFKRASVNSVLATATGQAQGAVYSSNLLAYVINGDVMKSYNSSFVLQQTITL